MSKKLKLICLFVLLLKCLYSLDFSKEFYYKVKSGVQKDYPEISYLESDVYRLKTEKDAEGKNFDFKLSQLTKLNSIQVIVDNKNFTWYTKSWKYIQSNQTFQSDSRLYNIEFYYKPLKDQEIQITRDISYKNPSQFSIIPIEYDPEMKNFKAEFEISNDWDLNIRVLSYFDSTSFKVTKTERGYCISCDTLNLQPKLKLLDPTIPFAYILCDLFYQNKKIISADPQIYRQNYKTRITDYSDEFAFFSANLLLDETGLEKTKNKEITKIKLTDRKRQNYLKSCVKKMSGNGKKSYYDFYHKMEGDTCEFNRVNIIFQYVQQNIRYFSKSDSTHDYIPKHPAEILANGYGDCKDMSCLIKTLSNHFGINVEYGLVNTKHDNPEGIAGDLLYNHIFCIYKNQKQSYYLDATDQYSSISKIPDYILNKYIFLYNDSENNFIKNSLPKNDFQISVNISTYADSLKNGDTCIILKGNSRSFTLRSLENYDLSDPKNYFSKLLSKKIKDIVFSNLCISAKTDTTLVVKGNADLSKFVVTNKLKQRTYYSKAPFNLKTSDILSREADSCPISSLELSDLNLEIKLKGSNFALTGDNISQNQGENFFFARSRFSEKTLILNYGYRIADGIYNGKSKTDFINFIKEYNKKKSEWFIQ